MTDRIARRPHGRRPGRPTAPATSTRSRGSRCSQRLKLGPDDRLLDVGCGGGVFLRHAVERPVARRPGSTTAATWCGSRARTSGVDVVQGEADELPFADGAFTAVSCIVAFFFFPDPVAALRELRRVLDPERGRLAIFTTAPEAKGTGRRRTRSRRAATSTRTRSSRVSGGSPGFSRRRGRPHRRVGPAPRGATLTGPHGVQALVEARARALVAAWAHHDLERRDRSHRRRDRTRVLRRRRDGGPEMAARSGRRAGSRSAATGRA